MVEQTVRAIAEAIAAGAPGGWTQAELHATAGRGGSSTTGGYLPRPSGFHRGVAAPHQQLMQLAEALGQDRGWEPVSMEFRCLPSGEYRFTAFHDAVTRVSGGMNGFEAVLDADVRLPQPGLDQPASTAAPAGDPELAAARFRAYLERRAAILGHPEELPPPATAADIAEAESRLGCRLPADLRALYEIADGDGVGYDHRYLFEGCAWLPLKSLVAEHEDEQETRPWYGWDLEWDAVVFDATPRDTVRRCGDHPGWLRFATPEDGNYLAVDTAPARAGRPGQVIWTGRDHNDGPGYVADSVTSLLGHYLDLLDQGAYDKRGDYIALREPAREHAPQEYIGGGVPEEVAPSLQAVHINDVPGPVDLTPLSAARGLRRLHLNRATTADLAPVRGLPVESLRAGLTGGDLTPLAGHPHLASLDLATIAPADLTPLRTVPRLRGLDLSAADIADVSVLTGLTGLRYLALDRRQWSALLDGAGAPPALAAARLTDTDATLDEALAWAARLGLDTAGPFRTGGSWRP
ncbi:SMI1/KNR4 family protein [Actinacidiphila bryophytorum]|uniref:SMI1_KNR4 domain-containing protein n=1 Tax=Actinacidiphila bryophytorum TaxID=1436133 RepID=A0A9W4H4I1_9ACTN|nr:SMI1/KNR4 family protein [Actinacidiphila bryophytorum]MBM9435862.1 SMI1/KNR4 family protein [Actinacidiphila bryophytorum]MBN6543297.1 SMI1/KNR4 family protein [Actinacidiphila bryophytorum]CAG7649841.1 SMI1_KNR4 domain-containing protein [Actinacidiphila bryophytorum]